MTLTKEIKDLIKKEYNTFKDKMYAGKSKEERDELAQFFTPPEISIRLIEELSDLKGNILDPTSGSGNLLAAALIAGADSDKVFGNDYDLAMVNLCRDRLNNVVKMLNDLNWFNINNRPEIQEWQIHRGNALIPDCLTEFSPDYNTTILAELLKRRNGLKGGWMANPEYYIEYKAKCKAINKEAVDMEVKGQEANLEAKQTINNNYDSYGFYGGADDE